MTIFTKLLSVQTKLKAPKNQTNAFGKYKYRSCEDILESVKPLLKEEGLTLFITDTVKETETGFMYTESRAILMDTEGNKFESTAQAGIDVNRKGMDVGQSFGASSSYARKYCLNGMFLIDCVKDSDTSNTHGKTPINKEASLPWLNEGTPEFKKAQEFISSGKGTLEQIRTKYSVSKTVAEKLTLK